MNEWSAQKVEKLTALWADGLTASMIAERLGFSRNAIIGKIHRLRLPTPSQKVSQSRPWNFYGPRQPQCKHKQVAAAVLPIQTKKDKPKIVTVPLPCIIPEAPSKPGAPVICDAPGARLVTLEKRKEGQCRWPVNDGSPFLYCGAPRAAGKPYCDHHWAISRQPPKKRRIVA